MKFYWPAAALVCAFVLSGPAWSQDVHPARARFEAPAERLKSAADYIADEVLTLKGQVTDAVLPDRRESLYSRFEDATQELARNVKELDRDDAKAKVNIEPSRTEKETRLIHQFRNVKSLFTAVESELAGGGFPNALDRLNKDVKPALGEIERALPALTTFVLENPESKPDSGRM